MLLRLAGEQPGKEREREEINSHGLAGEQPGKERESGRENGRERGRERKREIIVSTFLI